MENINIKELEKAKEQLSKEINEAINKFTTNAKGLEFDISIKTDTIKAIDPSNCILTTSIDIDIKI